VAHVTAFAPPDLAATTRSAGIFSELQETLDYVRAGL
jgi:hypothetical protein